MLCCKEGMSGYLPVPVISRLLNCRLPICSGVSWVVLAMN